MKQKAKQFLAMFLAVIMVVLLVPVTSGNSTAYAEGTIDSVRAAIKELSADPREFSAADKISVEAINADFESLSAEDQATLNAECTHSGTGQSLGRVLESALWSVWSYETDASTTLGDATYTTSAEPIVSSVSNKGKSDSSRTRNWWVEKVVVENGQATAYIYVTSGAATASKLTSYPSVWVAGQTINRDANNNYAIPVDINGITYFGGISSSMPTPIMYALETTIDESYNQNTVDKLPYSGNSIAFVKEDLDVFGMFTAQDGTTCEIDGDNVVIHFVPKNTTTYGGFHWGAITDTNLTKDVTFNADGTIDLTLSADEYCGYAHPVAPIKKTDETATTSTQYYLAIPAKDKLPVKSNDADYTAVDAAIAKVPADLSIYTDETAAAVTTAVNAVVRGKTASQQAEVDAMAQAIEDAIAALKKKESGNDPAVSKQISLYPVNDEAMFKVVNAYLEIKDGKTELVFALSAKGYEDVIPATYEEALAMDNKDAWASYKEAEVDCKYTSKGKETDEGIQNKYQFRVPVTVAETGKTKIPMISVSARERDTAEQAAGSNKPDYSKAFMARHFIVDMDAKELLTGSYQEDRPVTVTSEIDTFKVEKNGIVSILGCPPANEYEAKPTITLSDKVYDKAFIGKAADVDEEKAVAIGKDGKITLDFINSRSKGISLINGTNPITVAFHVSKTGEWVDREFVMDLKNKTITITGEEIKSDDEIKETPANYNKVNKAKKEAKKIDTSLFTDDSVKGLKKALDAVEENLTADKQKKVNEMANGIDDAMKKLKLRDGIYTIPANSLGNDFMDVIIEVEGGKMSAYVITTSRAQDKIYPGTKEEAEKGGKATKKLGAVKNSLGMPSASMFKIPIDAINNTLEFAVHSPDGWTTRKFVIKASDIKKAEYKIIENTNGKYTVGEDFTVSSDADFSKFVAVMIDGEFVDPTNYSVVSGSTKVTLKGKYTKALGEKSHELQILSHDGMAKLTISGAKKSDSKAETKKTDSSKKQQSKTNTNKNASKSVKTGDDNNVFAYVIILIASLVSVVFVYRRKQR